MFYVTGCKGVSLRNKDERDIVVPGQQLWYSSPSATGNDLCWPGRLRANAAGRILICPCTEMLKKYVLTTFVNAPGTVT